MSAAEELTTAEREFITRLLLKLTGSSVDAQPAKVVRPRPVATPDDFELVRRIRRRKGL
jgi:hypothetical protein